MLVTCVLCIQVLCIRIAYHIQYMHHVVPRCYGVLPYIVTYIYTYTDVLLSFSHDSCHDISVIYQWFRCLPKIQLCKTATYYNNNNSRLQSPKRPSVKYTTSIFIAAQTSHRYLQWHWFVAVGRQPAETDMTKSQKLHPTIFAVNKSETERRSNVIHRRRTAACVPAERRLLLPKHDQARETAYQYATDISRMNTRCR